MVRELWRPLALSKSVKSGQVWYHGREATTGLLKIFIGTQLETGQLSVTLAKVSEGAKLADLNYFEQGALHGILSHRWERGLSSKRKITAVQGVVDRCVATIG